MSCMVLSDDRISEIRDALILKSDDETLSVTEQNVLRDCDIALGLVACRPETQQEARHRVTVNAKAGAR